jgi:spore coat polysaccharide biosynthesis protein SpsF (cytidylyltransferase family)
VSSDARLVAVVQARASSTRFPGKVLADLGGKPLLRRLLDRLRRSRQVAEVVVATSTLADDDQVAALAEEASLAVVRGPLDDVLERFRIAADRHRADAVVRITGDCPLVDPELVDTVAQLFRSSSADYVSNVSPPTYPDGLDVEVIARGALERAAAEATRSTDREHVTLFIARQPDRFPHLNFTNDVDLSELRWTVDYPEDLDFVRAVFAAFPGREEAFGYREVVVALETQPGLRALMPTLPRNEGLAESLHAERD